MKNQIIGLNIKSLRKIPILGLLLMISFFFPYIEIKSEGIRIAGYRLFLETMNRLNDGGNYIVFIYAVILGIFILSVILSSIFVIVKPGKKSVILSICTYIFNFTGAILILFTITKTINGSGLLSIKFLISYLSSGYWIFLFGSLIGLILSLRAAKMNPGYIILVIMGIIWVFPIAWIIMISFRLESGSYTSYFWPKEFTFKNYLVLLTDSSKFPYLKWFGNTLFVSVFSCALTTFIVLSTAFTLSRIRFFGRKLFMNIVLILGMFPGFMSMIAVYYILKGMNLTQSLIALILVYSSGAAMGYYIAKGFFDTIPKALDEAACIDGATKWQVFTRITIPISKPIIIYTVLTSFMSPWADFIFARVIMGDDYEHYTVALGLFTMLSRENIDTWYTRFAAGAVLISIPIAILFITLQKYYVEGLSGSVKG